MKGQPEYIMKSLIVTVILVGLQAGPTESQQCIMDNCRASFCDYDKCSKCKNNYYLDKNTDFERDYCHPCPSSCSLCYGFAYCSTCNTGFFGSLCSSQCTDCKHNICDKAFGLCTYGCIAGYYQETDGTCSQCPSRCSQCSSSVSCSECKDSNYWGAICEFNCDHCQSCSKSGGCSSGCNDGYYLSYNANKRGNECKQCRWACTLCTAYDNCQSCRSRDWGPVCQNRCGQCSICSKSDGCSSGCNNGYYMRYIDTKKGYECHWCTGICTSVCKSGFWGTKCQNSCPPSCGLCTSDSACSSCVAGNWGSYCQNSCSACSDSTCDKSQGCVNGCISGYYKDIISNYEHHCKKCLEECKTCGNGVSCSSCNSGFAGLQCQHDCRNCNGQICDFYTGDCTHVCASNEYFKMDSSGTGCFSCPESCSSCSSASQCTGCVTGKWGNTCGSKCPENCKNKECVKTNGYCSTNGCVDGFFGNKCTSSCLSTCNSCRNGYSCQTCLTGHFNGHNDHKCECSTDKCSIIEGNVCKECSDNTFYPKSNGCCPCSANCKNNICSSDATCIDCIDGKHGTNCESNCYYKCKDNVCYRNGSCIACTDDRYFGSTCSSWCPYSISRCYRCYGLSKEILICTRCNNHWYADGAKCTACSVHCKTGANPKCDPSTGACKTECDPGWFGERCDINCNVTDCQTCSEDDPNICIECDENFYSETNSSCITCPQNCLTDTICNKRNGSCSKGCDENWSGEQCDIPCPSACTQCDQDNKSNCSLCKEDFYGDSCEYTCSSGCVTRNKRQTCDKSNGTCTFDCKNRLWGVRCDKQCGEGCSGNVCNRTTGKCLGKCLETHFGLMCDSKCNENCVNTTGRSCDETDGNCLNGCESGWFGKRCNDECGQNCKERICYRNNGSCTSGCIDGYTGSLCSQALLSDDPPGTNAAAIGGGAGAGVAVLVILVVIVMVVVLRRRKTSSKMETRNGRSVEKKQSFKQTDPTGPEYSNINEARIEKEGSEIHGVTNQMYANTLVRMSGVSEKEEVINVKSIPARPTSEDYLKEVEQDYAKEVDDDEADAVGTVDDTYYNIGGQRVAVAILAEYIKHKPVEEILNDFDKIPKGLLKSYNEAKKGKNATKNKYRAIYPYDENRVVLLGGEGDYMNASYIDGYNRSKEYIASSGPFERSYDTTSDFWRMIWQERCETLVMLTKPFEDGQAKCTKYWPDADEGCRYGDINIACLTEDVYADFTIRILIVKKGEESLNIRHVHFTAWPDKGIPHDVTSMIELRQKVRSLHKDKECPMIVHCSAGIGRTGTFIVLDMLTYEGEDRGSVDIYGSVASLRYQRCNMVQTPEQYVYLHHAVLHSLTFDCRSIPGDMFLQNYNKLIQRNGGERIIDKQFQQLQSITEEQTDEDRAQIVKNKTLSNKNRKGADIPADESRVKLHENRKPGASDYINAVFVNSFRKKRKFICAQTPLSTTVVDFLSLIHQERCTCVVSMEEPDIQDKTLKVYWPADNQVVKHGVFKVCCKDSKTTAHYVTKKLSITYHGPNGEESRDVILYIFTNWSKDSLVPKTSDSLLELVKTVDAMNRTSEYEAPVLIHCRTGAERSCLYCAVSVLIEKMEIEHEVSVVNTLRQIKARRFSAISSVEQYKFCHQVVISYLQSFDIYSNFSLKDADA